MRKLIIAVVCSSVLTGLAVLAWTALSQIADPAAADSYLSIPACALQEHKNDYNFYRSSKIYNATGSASYYVPVNLPHGSTIRKIRLLCVDNNASDDIGLALYRQNSTPAGYRIADIITSGNDPNYRTFTTTDISPRYVNNLNNCYFLQISLPGSDSDGFKMAQVKILYDAP